MVREYSTILFRQQYRLGFPGSSRQQWYNASMQRSPKARAWSVSLALIVAMLWLSAAPLSAAPSVSDPFTAPLDVRRQEAALLPAFSADLNAAEQWDRYTVSARVDPEKRTISGRLRLEYANRAADPLDRIYFYLFPNLPEFGGRLDIHSATVDDVAVRVRYESKRFLLRIDLPASLPSGASTAVVLDFSAAAPLDAGQRYYAAFNRERGVLALASALPMAARRVEGAWQLATPLFRGDLVTGDTALYDVTLTIPAAWTAVTTGTAIESQNDGAVQTTRFVSGPQRDFTIVLTRFPSISAEVDGTRITSYFRSENPEGGRAALDAAVNALRVFNRRFGPYPLTELDIVQIDARKFLGVEYPGLIMIDRRLYTGERAGLEIIVAHEVAHQWWYSMVGNDVQNEAWLDEGLTSFTQVVYQEELRGAAAAAREIDGFRATYLRARQAGRDAPLKRPVSALRGNYTAIAYAKGALFFQALRVRIGEPAFDRFLRDYYAAFRYRIASSDDVRAVAENACACDLNDFYRDWVLTAAPVAVP
ncbi:MAG: peptidase M1 [Roseiflexus sp.]|nr:MAG: peptidase M1 [Roseiflexus sp.]